MFCATDASMNETAIGLHLLNLSNATPPRSHQRTSPIAGLTLGEHMRQLQRTCCKPAMAGPVQRVPRKMPALPVRKLWLHRSSPYRGLKQEVYTGNYCRCSLSPSCFYSSTWALS